MVGQSGKTLDIQGCILGFGSLAPPSPRLLNGHQKKKKRKGREKQKKNKERKDRKKETDKSTMTNRAPFKHKQGRPGPGGALGKKLQR